MAADSRRGEQAATAQQVAPGSPEAAENLETAPHLPGGQRGPGDGPMTGLARGRSCAASVLRSPDFTGPGPILPTDPSHKPDRCCDVRWPGSCLPPSPSVAGVVPCCQADSNRGPLRVFPWLEMRDLNPLPTGYQPVALPNELISPGFQGVDCSGTGLAIMPPCEAEEWLGHAGPALEPAPLEQTIFPETVFRGPKRQSPGRRYADRGSESGRHRRAGLPKRNSGSPRSRKIPHRAVARKLGYICSGHGSLDLGTKTLGWKEGGGF